MSRGLIRKRHARCIFSALAFLLAWASAVQAAAPRLVIAYSLDNIKRILATSNPKAANVKAEELIDDSFLQKFDKNGLLDRALVGSLPTKITRGGRHEISSLSSA